MMRTLILGLVLLAAARAAVADDTMVPPAATASAAAESVDATGRRSKKQAHAANPADVKADAASTAGPGTQAGDVKMSGMSILGNEDTPKSLALVPWKSSQLGEMPSVSRLLDSSADPVDKDVFMRELAYFSFKSGAK